MSRVLVIESDPALRADLVAALRAAGWNAEGVAHFEAARRQLRCAPVRALLVDLPDRVALRRFVALRREVPDAAFVAMGANPTVELAVEALKRGAHDFLRKPFSVARLESALAAARAKSASGQETGTGNLVTRDRGMKALLQQAATAAVSEATILIVGESGTGKDLLARWIHLHSPRSGGPFVAVNCAALPESLAESELFGHERGAFTGAVEARRGQILAAEGGTLLLDEVSELAPALQPKLLRVLQEREVLPVGGTAPVPVDLRVIATTQHDLQDQVRSGAFREDLYYRLDVIVLELPPLRARSADIELLARLFLDRFAKAQGTEPPLLDAAALERLRRHPFPGNVRELENLMRRAAVLFAGRPVDVDALLARRTLPAAPPRFELDTLNLRELERRAIEASLARSGGNRTHASRALGISVRTLRNKIRQYGLA